MWRSSVFRHVQVCYFVFEIFFIWYEKKCVCNVCVSHKKGVFTGLLELLYLCSKLQELIPPFINKGESNRAENALYANKKVRECRRYESFPTKPVVGIPLIMFSNHDSLIRLKFTLVVKPRCWKILVFNAKPNMNQSEYPRPSNY